MKAAIWEILFFVVHHCQRSTQQPNPKHWHHHQCRRLMMVGLTWASFMWVNFFVSYVVVLLAIVSVPYINPYVKAMINYLHVWGIRINLDRKITNSTPFLCKQILLAIASFAHYPTWKKLFDELWSYLHWISIATKLITCSVLISRGDGFKRIQEREDAFGVIQEINSILMRGLTKVSFKLDPPENRVEVEPRCKREVLLLVKTKILL